MSEATLTSGEVNEVLEKYNELLGEVEQTANFDYASFEKGYRASYGAYNPSIQNQLMKSMNLNPLVANAQEIERALDAPKDNEDNLIGYSQREYIRSMVYKRNFDYMVNLPTFNLSIQCKNANSQDYTSAAYKKDFKAVEEFMNKFDYREEFRKALFNMFNSETYYCLFRTDMSPDKYVLQDFPYKYSKITARFSHGLIADYDFSYFLNGMVDINLFPKWVGKKFNTLFDKGGSSFLYNPANPIGHRDSTFALWVQTDPEDGAWVFKLNPDFVANVPYFAPMLSDTSLIPVFRALQVNQSMAAAKKIISSQWPLLKEQIGGNVTDMLAVRSETMGAIVGTCAKALGEAFNIINIPSDKIDSHEFSVTDKDGYNNFLKTVSSLLGGGRSIFSTDKQTAEETRLSLNIDEMFVEKVYPQFEDFLDFYVNKLTKKFKFKFSFNDTNSYQNRERRKKDALEFANVGVVSMNKIANALDMDIIELRRELEMTKNTGFTDLLMPILNANTNPNGGNMPQDGSDKNGGAPKKAQSELSESGQNTRDSASNEGKG